MKLTVHLEKNSYPIYIGSNILRQADHYISEVFSGKRFSSSPMTTYFRCMEKHSFMHFPNMNVIPLSYRTANRPKVLIRFRRSTKRCFRQKFPAAISSSHWAAA